MSERFKVTSVLGFSISPGHTKGSGGRAVPTCSYAVLDTAYCYRVIEEFNTGASSARSRTNEARARALCAELNEWAENHGRTPSQKDVSP